MTDEGVPNVEKLPIDQMYDFGVDIDFEEQLYEQLDHGDWNPSQDIDWEAQDTVTQPERTLVAFLGTEFHFDNMFELMLCGRLLEQEYRPEAKVIAVMLADSKIRNAAAWAKYLDKLGETVNLSHAKREYFGELYTEENNALLLLGISVIGDVSWYAFMDRVDDVGDRTFKQIVQQIREQKRGQITHTVNYLEKTIGDADPTQIDQFNEQAAFFKEKMADIIRSHDDKITPLGKDTDEIAAHVTNYIDTFYVRIGLQP